MWTTVVKVKWRKHFVAWSAPLFFYILTKNHGCTNLLHNFITKLGDKIMKKIKQEFMKFYSNKLALSGN